MGCDIHLHGEVKIQGQWRHWNVPSIDRRYAMFAKMAGVRNRGDIVPISEPKGIPDDATFETLFDYELWEPDAHSASWLDRAEIAELETWLQWEHAKRSTDYFYPEQVWGFLLGSSWSDESLGIEDARFVFWFDN